MKMVARVLIPSSVFCLSFCAALSQQRPPATPLITHDPYFSVWSASDKLTDSDTTHWTGAPQPITGIVRIDGKAFRFMGRHPDAIPAMEQTGSSITATHTRYQFRQSGVTLELTFFTPAMMSDLDVLSRPVTYLTWRAEATDGAVHRVSVLVDVDPLIAVNDRSQEVVSFRSQTAMLNVLSVGSRDQNILNRSGDNLRIDWGYFHLAIPRNEDSTAVIAPKVASAYAETGKLPVSDSIGMPQPASRTSPHLAIVLDFGSVDAKRATRHLLVSYTEGYAIQYLE
jgi:hypothetical protein